VPCPESEQLKVLARNYGDRMSPLIATGLLDGAAGLVGQAIGQFLEVLKGRNALGIIECGGGAWDKPKDVLVGRYHLVANSLLDGNLPGWGFVFVIFGEVFIFVSWGQPRAEAPRRWPCGRLPLCFAFLPALCILRAASGSRLRSAGAEGEFVP
jgi:hypothetical protein